MASLPVSGGKADRLRSGGAHPGQHAVATTAGARRHRRARQRARPRTPPTTSPARSKPEVDERRRGEADGREAVRRRGRAAALARRATCGLLQPDSGSTRHSSTVARDVERARDDPVAPARSSLRADVDDQRLARREPRPSRLGRRAARSAARALRQQLVDAASRPSATPTSSGRRGHRAVQRSAASPLLQSLHARPTEVPPWRPPPQAPARSTRSTSSTSTRCSTTRSGRSATPCASSCASASCPTSATGSSRGSCRASSSSELAKLGLLGMHLEGYGLPGRQLGRLRARLPRARGRRRRRPERRLRAGVARDVRDLAVGLRGAEGALAPGDAPRRGDRLLRPDRAGRRLRSRARCARTHAATAPTGS